MTEQKDVDLILQANQDTLQSLLREVSRHYTRDDDLPDNLLPRIDAALEADQQQAYDQQAMDLCQKCGWKGIFPGEPCLVCNMQAKQVPMTDEQISEISSRLEQQGDTLRQFARAIEAHHDISSKGEKP